MAHWMVHLGRVHGYRTNPSGMLLQEGVSAVSAVYDDKWLCNKPLVLVFVETDQQQFA